MVLKWINFFKLVYFSSSIQSLNNYAENRKLIIEDQKNYYDNINHKFIWYFTCRDIVNEILLFNEYKSITKNFYNNSSSKKI